MKSEWEELEKLSKDELIIELVKSRFDYSNLIASLRLTVDTGYPAIDHVDTSRTTDEWAKKIVLYAYHQIGSDFIPDFCSDYGLDQDQADNICEKLVSEGKIDIKEVF